MPAPNQNPMYDPMANKPKLSTMPPQVTNDVAGGSLVRPMSPPMPPTQAGNQRRQIGGSSGRNFSPAAWNAANQRPPRPVNVLPGIGMGPMPVGTKPLPNPYVRDGRGGLDSDKFNDPFYRGTRLPSPDEIARHEAERGGQSMGMPAQYGGPDQGRDFNMPNYGESGGLGRDGIWRPPSQEYLDGLQNGSIAPKWAGAPGSDTYQGWLNLKAMRGDQYGGGQGGAQLDIAPTPLQPAATPPQGGRGRQPLRPGMEYRPGGGQRPIGGGVRGVPQDGGQSQLPPGLWQRFDSAGGGMDPAQHAQWSNGLGSYGGQQPRQFDPRMGSGYYGAF